MTNAIFRSSGTLTAEISAPTAASVAASYFQKEVDLHQSVDLQSKTLVILHDDCYGHRFSRPRTSKAALGTIVERPERIRASALGVSAAYVRLGRRHAGELFPPSPLLEPLRLPVPFQVRKTSRALPLSAPAVTNVHGTKWMNDLNTMCNAAESRLALDGRELVRPRSAGKDGSVADAPQLHEGDLYLCSESLNAFEGALGGVCEGVDAVFGPESTERAFIGIRPPGHHCSSGHPSGFCWINNVHVGISYAAMTHGLTHAAILDFDLHHGDGSQEIAWEQNRRANAAHWNSAGHKKAMVGYFSMHDINSYPCEMGEPDKLRNASVCIDGAHGQSIWNVHLEPWRTIAEFWEHYKTKYTILLEKARAFLRLHTQRLSNVPNGPQPKAAIFISAGFDASEWEGVGMQRHKVNIPTDFYTKFTADVVRMAKEEELGVDGRVISVLEGGYSDRALTSGVFSHLAGLGDDVLDDAYTARDQQDDRSETMDYHEHVASMPNCHTEWWKPSMLDELESLVYPPQSPRAKPRETSAPTFLAPTRSSSAKQVATPTRDRKTTSSPRTPEPDSPPLPDVGWATATHELFKILVPSNRQTTSYQPAELNAEASRLRRERQIASTQNDAAASVDTAATAVSEESKMQLRSTRKSRVSQPSAKEVTRPQTRDSRRTTIDVVNPSRPPSADGSTGMRGNSRRESGTVTTQRPGQKTSARPAHDGSQAPSRPGTAASHRSSVSTATRRSSTSRPTVPRQPSISQKVPPVPRIPPTHGSTGSSDLGKEAAPAAEEKGSVQGEHSRKHEVDGLSAGMQKLSIKLKVPTPKENAAREREKKAADQRKGTSSSVAPRPTATAKGGVKTSHPAVSKSSPEHSQAGREAKHERHELNLETSDPKSKPENPGLQTQPATSGTPSSDAMNNNTNYDGTRTTPQTSTAFSPPLTPGVAQSSAHIQSDPSPAVYSPPTTSTSQIKHGLPVFSSTGPIPFGPPRNADN